MFYERQDLGKIFEKAKVKAIGYESLSFFLLVSFLILFSYYGQSLRYWAQKINILVRKSF